MKYTQIMTTEYAAILDEMEVKPTDSPDIVLDALLRWEGIIGYTGKILSWIECVYGIDLE